MTQTKDELLTPAQKEDLLKRLERVTAMLAHPLDDEAITAGSFIFELEERNKTISARDRADVFLDLCGAVATAFPDGELSDTAIRKHPLTPYLMRYVLNSLKRVNESSKEFPNLTPSQFARAFLFTNTERNPGKMITRRKEILDAAPAIRDELEKQGLSPTAVRSATVAHVYDRIYRDGNTGEVKTGDRRRALEQIEELLEAQGILPYVEHLSGG